MIHHTKVVYLDLETTGVEPLRHAVWNIGLIVEGMEYNWILELKPEQLANASSMALSIGNFYRRYDEAYRNYCQSHRFAPISIDPAGGDKIVREGWQSHVYIPASSHGALMRFIAAEIGRRHLVGAVPNFDERFLRDLMAVHQVVPAWHYHLVDVEALAAGVLKKPPPWNSMELYKELGVYTGFFDTHEALEDARLARSVYCLALGLPDPLPHAVVGTKKEEASLVEDAPA